MANLSDRLLKGFRAASNREESAEDHSAEHQESSPNNSDVLDRLGIVLQTSIPETVLSSQETKAMRFARSNPGYYYPEVEKAVEDLSKTLSWHEGALHKRDLDIHKLASEVDQLETALTNKNYQLESLAVTGSNLLVDEDHNPLAPDSLEAKLAIALENERNLRAALENSSNLVAQARDYTSYQDTTIAELQERIAAFENSTDTATMSVPNPSNGDEELQAELETKNQDLREIQATNEALNLRVSELVEQLSNTRDNDGNGLAQDYAALQAWAEKVTPQYEQAIERISSLESENKELVAQVAELDDKLEQAKTYSTQLELFAAETDAYIDTLVNAADSAVVAQEAAAQVATQYLSDGEEDEAVASTTSTHETLEVKHTSQEKAPAHVVNNTPASGSDEAFANFLQDLTTPEVSKEEFSRIKQSRPTLDYAKASPGAPLTTLRPGESAGDIL